MSFNDTEILEEDIIYKCTKCNSIFKNSHTLNLHQKTSETCSEINHKINVNDKECFYCNKVFSSKQMKKYHESKCIYAKLYELTIEYENKLKEMKIYYEKEINILKNNNTVILN
jgi:uncharacterized Zn-finger protein